MITAFSFARNGWINYDEPPRVSVTTQGRPVPFRNLSGAVSMSKQGEPRPIVGDFAYATKAAAEALDTTKPANPREWSKVVPIWNPED